MNIEPDSLARSIAVEEAKETAGPSNQFIDFISRNNDQFIDYSSTATELRRTKKAWRLGFAPFLDQVQAVVASRGSNSKKVQQTLASYITYVFETPSAGPIEAIPDSDSDDRVNTALDSIIDDKKDFLIWAYANNVTGVVGNRTAFETARTTLNSSPADVREAAVRLGQVAGNFRLKYLTEVNPILSHLQELGTDLGDKFLTFLFSEYQTVVDTVSFLSDPKYAKEREIVGAFFRDFSTEIVVFDKEKGQNKGKRKEDISVFQYIRQELQRKTQVEYDPLMFSRFWEQTLRSGIVNNQSIMDIMFGIDIGRSLSGQEDTPEVTPNELSHSIGKVSFDKWTKGLKDAYLNFATRDLLQQMGLFHDGLIKQFPKAIERPIYVKENGNGFDKRKEDAQAQKSNGNISPEANGANEESLDAKRLGLGILKAVVGSKDTHYIIESSPEKEDELLADIIGGIRCTPQMREDFIAIIKDLQDWRNAYGPATTKLIEKDRRVTVNGKTLPLRRVNPNQLRDVVFKDPTSNQARITFVISEDGSSLLIKGIYTNHDDYTRSA